MAFKYSAALLLAFSLCCSFRVNGQESAAPLDRTQQIKVVVAAPDLSSDNVIAIPPVTSWSSNIILAGPKKSSDQRSSDLVDWVRRVSSVNGFQSTDGFEWHVVVVYDQFDEDGDNVHSGVFEEFWSAPKKYRISYKADNLNQTDYATDSGLFRLGDQRWPNPAESQVRSRIIDPFAYAATLRNYRMDTTERAFGTHSLGCVALQNAAHGITAPNQYCFDPQSLVLRYVRGEGWFQTMYNDIVTISGHNIARQVDVTDGGKPFLKLHVTTIEEIPRIDESYFVPPADAVNLLGKPVTGVSSQPLQTTFPEWPENLRHQHFAVKLEIVIGKNGQVTSAKAISGPPKAFKAAEEAARKWIYRPYLIMDQPSEVEAEITLMNN